MASPLLHPAETKRVARVEDLVEGLDHLGGDALGVAVDDDGDPAALGQVAPFRGAAGPEPASLGRASSGDIGGTLA